jgi:hypothetical protein
MVPPLLFNWLIQIVCSFLFHSFPPSNSCWFSFEMECNSRAFSSPTSVSEKESFSSLTHISGEAWLKTDWQRKIILGGDFFGERMTQRQQRPSENSASDFGLPKAGGASGAFPPASEQRSAA